MKRDNIETILWIFCIIVMIGLTLNYLNDSFKYDCSKCSVTLTNTISISKNIYFYENISIIKLIEAYKIGECLFVWSPTEGYVINGYKL